MSSMLSYGTLQPQVFGALSQLTSLLTGVRNLHGATRSTQRRKNRMPTSEAALVDSAASHTRFEESGLLSDLNLNDLSLSDIDNLVISPIVASIKRDASRGHWNESHVSAESFFENKNGFPESFLSTDLPAFHQVLCRQGFHPLLQRKSVVSHLAQSRGFKTRTSSVGMGKDHNENMFSKIFHKYEKNQVEKAVKGTSLVHDPSHDIDTNLKVAFAEGFHAHKQKDVTKSRNSRIFSFFMYVGIGFVAIYLLPLILAYYGGVRGRFHNKFEINPEEITVTFDDVKGIAEAKEELEEIVEFLRDPDKFTALGAKLPKGALLVGPPGTGKTLLARAVAGEAGVSFFHASGSEFDEILVGTGAKRVRELFAAAKNRAPCVIFIDEIDSVGAQRTSTEIHPYASQTVNQLLSEMDGFNQNTGVIVLGATNQLKNIDSALLRPGRFDVQVHVSAPNLKEREEILEYYVSKIKADIDIDVGKIAKSTIGFTGADLENLVNQAALKAAIDQATRVNMKHMEYAKDKVMMGPEKKTKIPDESTNLNTAYHEAGHALVALFTKDAHNVHKVTIVPRGGSLGHTSFMAEKEMYVQSRSQLLAQMDVAMGGRVAEELCCGKDNITTGASDDFRRATHIAQNMVKLYGMSDKVGQRVFEDRGQESQALQEEADTEIKKLLQESYERAKLILQKYHKEHKALAQALIEYETLDSHEVKALADGKSLSKS